MHSWHRFNTLRTDVDGYNTQHLLYTTKPTLTQQVLNTHTITQIPTNYHRSTNVTNFAKGQEGCRWNAFGGFDIW